MRPGRDTRIFACPDVRPRRIAQPAQAGVRQKPATMDNTTATSQIGVVGRPVPRPSSPRGRADLACDSTTLSPALSSAKQTSTPG